MRRAAFAEKLRPYERYLFSLLERIESLCPWGQAITTFKENPDHCTMQELLDGLARASIDNASQVEEIVGVELARQLLIYRRQRLEGRSWGKGLVLRDLRSLHKGARFMFPEDNPRVFEVDDSDEDAVTYSPTDSKEAVAHTYGKLRAHLAVLHILKADLP